MSRGSEPVVSCIFVGDKVDKALRVQVIDPNSFVRISKPFDSFDTYKFKTITGSYPISIARDLTKNFSVKDVVKEASRLFVFIDVTSPFEEIQESLEICKSKLSLKNENCSLTFVLVDSDEHDFSDPDVLDTQKNINECLSTIPSFSPEDLPTMNLNEFVCFMGGVVDGAIILAAEKYLKDKFNKSDGMVLDEDGMCFDSLLLCVSSKTVMPEVNENDKRINNKLELEMYAGYLSRLMVENKDKHRKACFEVIIDVMCQVYNNIIKLLFKSNDELPLNDLYIAHRTLVKKIDHVTGLLDTSIGCNKLIKLLENFKMLLLSVRQGLLVKVGKIEFCVQIMVRELVANDLEKLHLSFPELNAAKNLLVIDPASDEETDIPFPHNKDLADTLIVLELFAQLQKDFAEQQRPVSLYVGITRKEYGELKILYKTTLESIATRSVLFSDKWSESLNELLREVESFLEDKKPADDDQVAPLVSPEVRSDLEGLFTSDASCVAPIESASILVPQDSVDGSGVWLKGLSLSVDGQQAPTDLFSQPQDKDLQARFDALSPLSSKITADDLESAFQEVSEDDPADLRARLSKLHK